MWVVRILVVEDEVYLASAIARGLRQEGMAVDVALDGMTALEKASVTDYDVIVLDRDLPVVHGDDVCRQLVRSRSTARVLMLTASGGVRDRIEGLDLGADDYVPKPFAFGELVARVRAVSRRHDAPATTILKAGDVVVDPSRRVATRAGVRVDLSRNELAVLEVLVRADGAVVSAEELLERVWDEHIDPFTNTVRMTVMKLRRKLGEPPLIDTVTGEGYRIEP
jgi:DNA-binding response OmpR family regulator